METIEKLLAPPPYLWPKLRLQMGFFRDVIFRTSGASAVGFDPSRASSIAIQVILSANWAIPAYYLDARGHMYSHSN